MTRTNQGFAKVYVTFLYHFIPLGTWDEVELNIKYQIFPFENSKGDESMQVEQLLWGGKGAFDLIKQPNVFPLTRFYQIKHTTSLTFFTTARLRPEIM